MSNVAGPSALVLDRSGARENGFTISCCKINTHKLKLNYSKMHSGIMNAGVMVSLLENTILLKVLDRGSVH